MSAVKKAAKKVGKAVGGVLGGIFKAPKVVVEDNSQQVANAINQQAADEKKAKEAQQNIDKMFMKAVKKTEEGGK